MTDNLNILPAVWRITLRLWKNMRVTQGRRFCDRLALKKLRNIRDMTQAFSGPRGPKAAGIGARSYFFTTSLWGAAVLGVMTSCAQEESVRFSIDMTKGTEVADTGTMLDIVGPPAAFPDGGEVGDPGGDKDGALDLLENVPDGPTDVPVSVEDTQWSGDLHGDSAIKTDVGDVVLDTTTSAELDGSDGKACAAECVAEQPWCVDATTVGVCGTTTDGCTRMFRWPCPATQVCENGACQCTGIDGPKCHSWEYLGGSTQCGAPNPKEFAEYCWGAGCWKDACVPPIVGNFVNIVPTGADLRDVQVGPDGFIAVGGSPAVVHQTGDKLVGSALSEVTPSLNSVSVLQSGIAFAVGQYVLFRYDGSVWSVATMLESPQWIKDSDLAIPWSQEAVWAASDDLVFHGGKSGTLYRYDGVTSVPIPHPHVGKKDVWILGIWGSSATDVYIVGTPGVFLHYDGEKVAPVPGLDSSIGGIGGFEAVDGNGPDDVYATRDDSVWRLNGGIWAPIQPSPPVTVGTTDLAVTALGHIYLTDSTGYHWFDGGLWHTVEHGIETGYLYGVDAYGERAVFVGHCGLILDVQGNEFTLLTQPGPGVSSSVYVLDVWGTPDGAIFAVGEYGRAYRRIGSNPTEVWDVTGLVPEKALTPEKSYIYPGTAHTIGRVWASSANNAYLGSQGVVAHFDGTKWQKQEIPGLTPETIVTTIHGNGPANVYVGGYAPGVSGLLARWNGSGWATVSLPGIEDPTVGAVWVESSGEVLVLLGGWLYTLTETGPVKITPGWGGFAMGMQLCAPHIVGTPDGAALVGHGGVFCFTDYNKLAVRAPTGTWHGLFDFNGYAGWGLFHAAPTPEGNFVLVLGSQPTMLLNVEALTAWSLLYPDTNPLPEWAKDIVLRPIVQFGGYTLSSWVNDAGDVYLGSSKGNVIKFALDE